MNERSFNFGSMAPDMDSNLETDSLKNKVPAFQSQVMKARVNEKVGQFC